MWINIFTLILFATLAGCEQSTPENPGGHAAAALKKITVAYTTQPQSTLVQAAVAKGYFVQEGLDVQSSLHPFGKLALQQVLENKADIAIAAETPFMFAVLKGEKLFVIANFEQTTTNNAIVARRDAGISERAELAGKRIGYTPGTTGEFFLDSMLTAKGIARSEIQPVPLKPDEMLDAMLAKHVDAVSTWNYPLTLIKQQLGANAVVFFDKQIYTETFNAVAQQKFVQENPLIVQSFLRALIKAEAFVTQHTDEAQLINSQAGNVDIKLVRAVWGDFHYRVNLDQTLLITLEDETRWAIKNHLTDQTVMPDYRDYIHLDSLKAVSPGTVTIDR
ncbi:MAG: NrtA/SsuA/CpmA family ABC transporter substrate-binding protein [Gammaproteobacteria bacterium]|nr:NrtA/SsuA/CpmA family ABC transporter substrate-binding protein [Gammaproteobacteria bacterium]